MMKHLRSQGFTIVELLIVIVIIGILATLVIVTYNGIQRRANNTQTILSLEDTIKGLQLYAQQNQKYPEDSANPGALAMACIGTDYPGDKCMDISSGTAGGCGGVAAVPETTWLSSSIKPLLTKDPMPSPQKIRCNGRDIVGALYGANWGTPGVSILLYFLSGDVSCSAPAGLTPSKTNPDSSITQCLITMPAL